MKYINKSSIQALFFVGIVLLFLTIYYWKISIPIFLILTIIFIIYKSRRNNIFRTTQLDIEVIDKMTGKEFEDFLATFFRILGYRVKQTPPSRDYGADLILRKNNMTICVQAKRSSYNIGVNAVQEVKGSIKFYNACHGMVVTNNDFTTSARKLAQANDIELVSRNDLIQLLYKAKKSAIKPNEA